MGTGGEDRVTAERLGRMLSIGDRAIWCEWAGEGQTLVLLHGGMATNATWAAQFAGLSGRRRLVVPERTAHGHTPDRSGPLTYEAMAAETAEVVQALQLAPADIVGWSDGGMIALLLAIERPELVRTATLVGSGFSSDGYVAGTMEELTANEAGDQSLAAYFADYAEVSPEGPDHFPVVWEKVRRLWAEPFDWGARLGEITAPVLVIVGDDDYVTVRHADTLARRVPRGQLAVIPGASHLAPAEKPHLFNQLLLDFTDDPETDTRLPLRRRAGT